MEMLSPYLPFISSFTFHAKNDVTKAARIVESQLRPSSLSYSSALQRARQHRTRSIEIPSEFDFVFEWEPTVDGGTFIFSHPLLSL